MTMVPVNTINLSNTTYRNNPIIHNVNLDNVAWVDNSMSQAFYNSQNLQGVTNINSNVTNMSQCFAECTNLVNAPTISNGVENLMETFAGCTSLSNVQTLPASINNLTGTFSGCVNLTVAPTIPANVTSLLRTFENCSKLTVSPVLSSSITGLPSTFKGCTNLSSVPNIPSSVTSMMYTFDGCTSLSGNINIESESIANAVNCFANTTAEKEVYIPFYYTNGVLTATYNAFTAAGYSDTTRQHGVLLHSTSGQYIDLSDYEYTTTATNDVTLTKYIGTSTDIVTPNV